MNVQKWLKERDALLRSLDAVAYVRWARKHLPPYVSFHIEQSDVENRIAAMHKARLAIASFTDAEKEESRQWLKEHGYTPGLFGIEL